MTANEYITWLKGFTEACNDYHPTPAQWDSIKDKLAKVSDNRGVPVGIGGIGVLNVSGRTDVTSLPTGTNITYTTKHQLND